MNHSSPTKWTGLRLDPFDLVFCRDGRPFDAATRVSSGLPNPQTLAGALRTALLAKAGFDFNGFTQMRRPRKTRLSEEDTRRQLWADLEKCGAPSWVLNARFRGPWLAKESTGKAIEPLLPVPAILSRAKDGTGPFFRSRPLAEGRLPGWRDPHGRKLLPLWRHEGPSDGKFQDGFVTLGGIESFLAGGKPKESDYYKSSDLFAFDDRVGIVVDGGTLTAVDGEIYSIRFLALNKDVCLYAEVLPGGDPGKANWLPTALPLGGEGKYVSIQPVKEVDWPNSSASSGRSVWLLATPAFVGNQPWPTRLDEALLRAAASREPLAVSGWDIARGGPHPTRFAVPAGSTYFVEGDFDPPHGSLCTDPEQVAQGWGFVLRGTWKGDN